MLQQTFTILANKCCPNFPPNSAIHQSTSPHYSHPMIQRHTQVCMHASSTRALFPEIFSEFRCRERCAACLYNISLQHSIFSTFYGQPFCRHIKRINCQQQLSSSPKWFSYLEKKSGFFLSKAIDGKATEIHCNGNRAGKVPLTFIVELHRCTIMK